MILEIMRLSASRPEMLYRSTKSILDNIKFSGDFRWIYHEDFLNTKASEKCIEIAEAYEFDVIGKHNPAIGHGASLTWMLKQVQGDYVLNWEDDQAAIREIDLDKVIEVMEAYPNEINQIAFHKRKIEPEHRGFKAVQKEFNGSKLVTNIHWAYVPAVWRMSYIMPRWQEYTGGNHHWLQNAYLKGMQVGDELIRSAEWVLENTKTFYWGQIAEGAYIKHIGTGKSLRVGSYKWE